MNVFKVLSYHRNTAGPGLSDLVVPVFVAFKSKLDFETSQKLGERLKEGREMLWRWSLRRELKPHLKVKKASLERRKIGR